MLPKTEYITYNSRLYQLPKEFVQSLMQLKPERSQRALALTWLALVVLVTALRLLYQTPYFWYCYIPGIFLIAGRFGSLLQLIHEASHQLISPSRLANDRIARWLCAFPVGVFYDGYKSGHMQHHAHTNTEKDPKADTEKYRVVDFRKIELYKLLLKDISGITALSVFFAYKENEETTPSGNENARVSKIKTLLSLCLVQTILLAVLFQLDIRLYVMLWLVPAISPHMFLMRIRGIAEHGLSKQLGIKVESAQEGNFYTRSFLTPLNRYRFTPFIWIERCFIGSLYVYHHHEHHLFPTVPFYNLPILHEKVGPLVKAKNPDVYAAGYFAAALKNVLEHQTVHSLVPALDS